MFSSIYKSQYIGGQREKFVRLENSDTDMAGRARAAFGLEGTPTMNNKTKRSFTLGMRRGSEGFIRSLTSGVSKGVFPEDLNVSDIKIFDPQDKTLGFWNKLIMFSCILAVSIDPLFLYLPVFNPMGMCLHIDESLAYTTITFRSLIDAFYLIRILFQFRTAYIAPSSRVFGRGELVVDPQEIANRYIHRYFAVDVLSILPLPQIVVWRFFGRSKGSDVLGTKQALVFIVFLQYIPRFVRFIPLSSELKKTAGAFAETAWAGAAYYLLWFLLASHVYGAFWYLLAIERKDTCWDETCNADPKCNVSKLYCEREMSFNETEWTSDAQAILDPKCGVSPEGPEFNYGIYQQALTSKVIESERFFSKYFYCLFWGLKNLSTLGQGLDTSTYPGEVLFSISVAIFGLILFALLIGNMQTYLQSLSVRLEEMRIKRRDSEQWMHHRVLPPELRERVRRYDQYKWLETRGVNEESLVQNLPKDLRRDIKRHLCLNLVRRVPLFANMDERLLDAICERLKPSLYTEKTYIIREGDPVDEMLFIIRGRMESVTTDGGRSGFFNRGILREADFCGEELLTWALDPKAGANLPPSTRTVKALTEVEAFALVADELKFITTQFKRIQSRQVQQTFRFYSQQWRTWAAIYIQAAWRRYSRRKQAEAENQNEWVEGREEDGEEDEEDDDEEEANAETALLGPNLSKSSSIGSNMLASKFAGNAMRNVQKLRDQGSEMLTTPPPKPHEPDFGG